jgi:hypothetical protein
VTDPFDDQRQRRAPKAPPPTSKMTNKMMISRVVSMVIVLPQHPAAPHGYRL